MSLVADQNKRLGKKIRKTQKKKQQLQLEKNIEEGNDEIAETTLSCELKAEMFSSLTEPLSFKTIKALQEMGLSKMTEVQAAVIPKIMENCHVQVTAKTGSGKTLAFLIPVLENLVKYQFVRPLGTGVIILSPTRELCMQTYGVLSEVSKYHSQSCELLMGGASRLKLEQNLLQSGVNVIVTTPRRLCDHLENTSGFETKYCFCLVLDEADRLIDGCEEELRKINDILPKKFRQTVLVSATKNEKSKKLGKIMLPDARFVDINISQDKPTATVERLDHTFAICPIERKFIFLHTFLRDQQRKNAKVMVFFSSIGAVRFYNKILPLFTITNTCIHGDMRQDQRTRAYNTFCKVKSGILLLTSIGERGWDVPGVDIILQFDPPQDTNEYIHRVGRTARAGAKGQALMLLQEEEVGFITHLYENKVEVKASKLDWTQVEDVQEKYEHQLKINRLLRKSGVDAFYAYLRSYKHLKLKQYFDHTQLKLPLIAKSFGMYKVLKPNPVEEEKPFSERRDNKLRQNRFMPY